MIKLDLNPPADQLRQFGWFSLIGFPLVTFILTKSFGLPDTVFYVGIGLGIVMGLAALANIAPAIKPVYIGMMLLAWPIGMVVSTVLLGAIYYLMFTPVGLLFRLMGRDLLHREIDKNAASYWTVRTTQRTPASYMRLY